MRVIAGQYRGRRLRTSSGPGYRPATGRVREAIFSMLEALGLDWNTTAVADIFAGSGALGIEALSRGARSAVFVEKAATAAALIRSNLEVLGTEQQRWTVVKTDALRWLEAPGPGQYNLVFIDPPYGRNLLQPAIDGLLAADKLAPEGLVCAEVEAGLTVSAPPHPRLRALKDKLYGQTRIYLWSPRENASPCTQAPLTHSPMVI